MLGIIGAGNMAQGIISGLVESKVDPASIMVSDVNQASLDKCQATYGVKTTLDNKELVDKSDTILFAIKPQQLEAVVGAIQSDMSKKLVLSILAGTSTETFEKLIGGNVAVVRAMPNLAAMIQSSITALFANQHVSEKEKKFATQIFRAIGEALWVEQEADMHTVTAISGSGPSYFFFLIQQMVKAATELGLDENTARKLAEVTCVGAGKVVQNADETSLEQLIANVCSKGGTTEAAMNVINQDAPEIIKAAVKAAHHRSVELSGES